MMKYIIITPLVTVRKFGLLKIVATKQTKQKRMQISVAAERHELTASHRNSWQTINQSLAGH